MKQKILAEIERLKKTFQYGSSAEAKYRVEVYTELIDFINSLPEEPLSEDLEEANKQYRKEVHNQLANTQGMCWEFDWDDVEMAIDDAFKAGAQWQKEQIMKEAIDAKIGSFTNGTIYDADFNIDSNLKDDEKIKIIIIKSK